MIEQIDYPRSIRRVIPGPGDFRLLDQLVHRFRAAQPFGVPDGTTEPSTCGDDDRSSLSPPRRSGRELVSGFTLVT